MEVSQKQFLKLYEPVHESFARFCHAKAYGLIEAEDLISETIIVVLENFHKLKNQNAFLSFLFSTASNILNKKNRRLKFKGNYSESNLMQIPDDSLDPLVKLDISLLYDAMNELPEKQKEAIILFEISGFSIKEVAQIQNSGISSVKQRLKRGREKLAELLNVKELKEESINKPSSILMTLFL